MNLIILTEKDRKSQNTFSISDNRATHIRNILKSEIGDLIEVGLINDKSGTAKITAITDKFVELEMQTFSANANSARQIDIICALPRPQTLKKVLHTCGTMGVNHLYLIRSEKVEKSYFHSPLLEEKNYTRFLIEGLSQGKRTKLPKVTIYKKFKEFFNLDTFNNSTCLLAHPDESTYLDSCLFVMNKNIKIAIGPEGGWNNFEVDLMTTKGFIKFKLSESILRVENAVTASISQVELVCSK